MRRSKGPIHAAPSNASGSATMRVFAFLDLEHPPVAWAVMRGMMVSAEHAFPAPHTGAISFMLAGMIEFQNNPRLFNESVVESVRRSKFNTQVSRVRGMYFFRSKDEAIARIGDMRWPEYFQSENLLELELHGTGQQTVVDTNWITFAPRANDGRLEPDELDWTSKYWAGELYCKSPVWELVANGVALVLDTDVRRRCFEYVKTKFSESHIPILMVRLAAEAGTRGGLITPFLLRKNEREIELQYRWVDYEFHDPDVIAQMAEHPDFGHLAKLFRENETWKIPDFRPWGRTFTFGIQPNSDIASEIIPSVHHTRRDASHAGIE